MKHNTHLPDLSEHCACDHCREYHRRIEFNGILCDLDEGLVKAIESKITGEADKAGFSRCLGLVSAMLGDNETILEEMEQQAGPATEGPYAGQING